MVISELKNDGDGVTTIGWIWVIRDTAQMCSEHIRSVYIRLLNLTCFFKLVFYCISFIQHPTI